MFTTLRSIISLLVVSNPRSGAAGTPLSEYLAGQLRGFADGYAGAPYNDGHSRPTWPLVLATSRRSACETSGYHDGYSSGQLARLTDNDSVPPIAA